MRRRTFLATTALTASTALAGRTRADSTTPGSPATQTAAFDSVMLDSTASLLDADGEPLTDESLVPVFAAETAENTDEDGNGDAVLYPEGTPIPLVAVDGPVAAFGAPFVEDDVNFNYGNEQFALNVWDALVGGGRVLWDAGHDQYYTADRFQSFVTYVERNGYTVEETTTLVDSLDDADAVVITSPSIGYSTDELDALRQFRAEGGAILVHHQSDFDDFDETDNLNALAAALDLQFRFNDDQVVDDQNNAGAFYQPTTARFNTDEFDLFASRPDLGFEFDPAETYAATVEDVSDGDTVSVRLENGRVDEIRILGIDTPEVPEAVDAERVEEWEGIEDVSYLGEWGDRASSFAVEELADADVSVRVDPDQPNRDPFGRLLAYVEYDDGTDTVDWSRRVIEEGYARVFDSGGSRHDELWRLERQARADGTGLWAASDPENSGTVRNGDYDAVFVPTPVPVGLRGSDSVPDDRVPVRAAESASPAGAPLVTVDAETRLAALGGPMISEDYETATGFPEDTAAYGNFPLVTSLIDALAADGRDGDIYIEGGHRQFNAGYALSAEDAVFYQRYLEGVDTGFEQVNDLPAADLSTAKGLVISTPAADYTTEEYDALQAFVDDGGAVVLVGSSEAPDLGVIRLNSISTRLGSDLQFGLNAVRDGESNLVDDPTLPVTTALDDDFGVFGPYDPAADTTLVATSDSTTTTTPEQTANQGPTDSPTAQDQGQEQPGFGVAAAISAGLGAGLIKYLRGGSDGDGEGGD